MMMSPISDDITAYLPRPLPPPTSVELHHQLPLHHQQHQQQQQQRRWKPSSASEVAPNCPRCDSANTKFCYYNNYSLAQPRYFCKGCRRYWTKGGSLRNVPVGGGCRKNRRGRSSSMRVHGDSRGRAEQTGPSAAQQQQHPGNSAGMLEDIAGSGGNNAAAASSTTSSSGGTSRASEGSDIDLAVLYAKYLSDQSSEQESSPESQQLGAMELPAAADPTVILDVEPTVFEFDYAALGHHLPSSDEAAGHFATSSVITSSEAAQLHDMGFDGGVGQFQFLMPETDGLSSGVDDSFWVNSLPIGSGNSTWLQQQCPGEQFVLPMIPDQQTDPMGPLAHHQSMLLGGGGSWAAIDPWSIDAVTRL